MRKKCDKRSWKLLFTLFQLAVHHLLWQIKKTLTFLLNHPADRVSSCQGDTRDIPVTDSVDSVCCCLERHSCEKLRSFPVVILRPAAMANAKKGEEEKKEEAALKPNLPKLSRLKWLKKLSYKSFCFILSFRSQCPRRILVSRFWSFSLSSLHNISCSLFLS